MNSIATRIKAKQQEHAAAIEDASAAQIILGNTLLSVRKLYEADFKKAVAIENDPEKTQQVAAWLIVLAVHRENLKTLETEIGALGNRIYALKTSK